MNKKINYIEYGVGNFLSIKNSLIKINCDINIVDNPKKFNNNLHTLLPGIGNFHFCMKQLAKNNFIDFLKNENNFKKNLVGICVGMQIMFEKSQESGECIGLGIFKGKVVDLKKNGVKKTPIIGWQKIYGKLKNSSNNKYYFIHSFGNLDSENVVSYYIKDNIKINCIVKKKNFIGFQFHPEKSGNAGLDLLNEYFK